MQTSHRRPARKSAILRGKICSIRARRPGGFLGLMVCPRSGGVSPVCWCVPGLLVCPRSAGVSPVSWCVPGLLVCPRSAGVSPVWWCVPGLLVCPRSGGVSPVWWCVPGLVVCPSFGNVGPWRGRNVCEATSRGVTKEESLRSIPLTDSVNPAGSLSFT